MSQFCYDFIDELFSYFLEHVYVTFFVFVEVSYKTNEPLSSALNLLDDITLQTCQGAQTQQLLRFVRSFRLVLIVFRYIQILEFHSLVLANIIFDSFYFICKICQLFIVVIYNIFFFLLFFLQLLLQLNFLQHIDLLFQQVVNKKLDQGRNMSRNYFVGCSREQRYDGGVIAKCWFVLQTSFPLLVKKLQLFLPQCLPLMVCLALADLKLSSWLFLTSNILVTFSSIVSRILFFIQNFQFLFEFFLISNSLFLYFSLQIYQLCPFSFYFIEFALIRLIISNLLFFFFLDETLQLLYLLLLLFLKLNCFCTYSYLFMRDICDYIQLLFLELCFNPSLFSCQLVFPHFSVKNFNFSAIYPVISFWLFFPRLSLSKIALLSPLLACATVRMRYGLCDFFLLRSSQRYIIWLSISDDKRLEVELVVISTKFGVLSKTQHN